MKDKPKESAKEHTFAFYFTGMTPPIIGLFLWDNPVVQNNLGYQFALLWLGGMSLCGFCLVCLSIMGDNAKSEPKKDTK